MTPKEAIDDIKWLIQNRPHNKELCEICINALEKQIPKKVVRYEGYWEEECPNCKTDIADDRDNKYCTICGQALDWSDE